MSIPILRPLPVLFAAITLALLACTDEPTVSPLQTTAARSVEAMNAQGDRALLSFSEFISDERVIAALGETRVLVTAVYMSAGGLAGAFRPGSPQRVDLAIHDARSSAVGDLRHASSGIRLRARKLKQRVTGEMVRQSAAELRAVQSLLVLRAQILQGLKEARTGVPLVTAIEITGNAEALDELAERVPAWKVTRLRMREDGEVVGGERLYPPRRRVPAAHQVARLPSAAAYRLLSNLAAPSDEPSAMITEPCTTDDPPCDPCETDPTAVDCGGGDPCAVDASLPECGGGGGQDPCVNDPALPECGGDGSEPPQDPSWYEDPGYEGSVPNDAQWSYAEEMDPSFYGPNPVPPARFYPDRGDLWYNGGAYFDSYLMWRRKGGFRGWTGYAPGYEHDLNVDKGFGANCSTWTNLPYRYNDCPTAGWLEPNSARRAHAFGTYSMREVRDMTYYFGSWTLRNSVSNYNRTYLSLTGQEVQKYFCAANSPWCMNGVQSTFPPLVRRDVRRGSSFLLMWER